MRGVLGHTLEAMLQPHTQVLNFALGAQGLNQALFRYERDAHAWKPHIVIIGITSSMIKRNNNIYPFLKDPGWGSPFARPRFVMEGDALTTVSEPVTPPKEIFDKRTISEVPNLELDDYYRPFEWKRGGICRLAEESYIFRFAYSLRPPSDDREDQRNTNAIQLGEAVIKRLVREVLGDGAIPLVVYLPYKDEIISKRDVALSARMLQNAGIQYFDPTSCLMAMDVSDAYMKESHYSAEASTHIAGCLSPLVRKMLTAQSQYNHRQKSRRARSGKKASEGVQQPQCIISVFHR
jgi:hypothetical protein